MLNFNNTGGGLLYYNILPNLQKIKSVLYNV